MGVGEERKPKKGRKGEKVIAHLIHHFQSLDVGVLSGVEFVDDERSSIGWEVRDPGRQLSGRRNMRHRTRTCLD